MLQGVHAAQSRNGVQQLDWGRGMTRSTRTKEIQEFSVTRMLHRLLDELNDGGSAVRFRLLVEAKHT